MSNSDSGKEQKNTQDGRIRFEYANGEIVIIGTDGVTKVITIGGDNQKILMKDDTAVNRILLDSENGLFKLSQPTYDVETASDNQLIWSSEFNIFKISKYDEFTITPSGTTGGYDYNYTHNLGFTPTAVAFRFIDSTSARIPLPSISVNSATQVGYDEKIAISPTIINYHLTVHTTAGGDSLSNFSGHKILLYMLRETI